MRQATDQQNERQKMTGRRPTSKVGTRRHLCGCCDKMVRRVLDHGCCVACDKEYGEEFNLENMANRAHWAREDAARGM